MQGQEKIVMDISQHSRRTAQLAAGLTSAMGIDPETREQMILAARLHDIGKYRIPGEILNKPGKLTRPEMEVVEQHVQDGYQLLKGRIPEESALMVLYHHENLDGSGYLGRRGDQIPLGARVIRVCDVYDALVSSRPYKAPWSSEEAVEYIHEQSGILFDRECADALCTVVGTGR